MGDWAGIAVKFVLVGLHKGHYLSTLSPIKLAYMHYISGLQLNTTGFTARGPYTIDILR